MLWDTHMHSLYSGDCDAPQEEMIRAAKNRRLSGICFTDHLDLDYPDDPDFFLLNLPGYTAAVRAAQQAHPGFPVLLGIELGLQPHLAAAHTELLARYPFDFVIGSSHLVCGADPYYPAFWENRSEEEGWLLYFSSILENIRAFDGFDVYGHLDYIVRYGPNRNRFYDWRNYADLIDAVLTELISRGKGLELNTGGYKYGLGHPNPTEEILARYRALGGEIVTVGSDAHAPEHVAFAFDKVSGLLKAAGFSYFTVYKDRKPEFIRLP